MPPTPVTWDGHDSQGNPLRWDSGLTWDGNIPEPQPTPKRMPQLRVLLGFGNMADHTLEETAGAVSVGLFGNPAFPDPPVTKVDFDAALDAFSKAIPAAKAGGPVDTADKNNKRAILIDMLRKLAGYVQANHGNDLASLLSTGFHAVSMNRAQSALPAPSITAILNGTTGQLLPQIPPIPNANGYEPRSAAIGADGIPGPWVSGGVFSNTRDLALNGLTPGVTYIIQVRAVGGINQYSDWSDSVSHMCM